MGEVHRAYDERLSRWVAIKQVRPDKAGSARARSRLRREARAVAGLAHPAIVQLFDILDVEEGYWIVMELVDGQTLANLLQQGPIDVGTTTRIGRQVAEGLAHAHEMGIVHRDLKVENVMLSMAGRARILDFGLVKDLNETEGTQTVDGALLGTLRAMSPEQAAGQAVDSRSDLFSLGTLLYECLSGIRPFEASSAAATLQSVMTLAPEPVRNFNAEVPPELSELIDRLLEKQPQHRPRATVVAGRLRHIERFLESLDSQTATGLTPAFQHGNDLTSDLLASTLDADSEEARLSNLLDWRLGALLIAVLLGISAAMLPLRQPGQPTMSPGHPPSSVAAGTEGFSESDSPVALPESPFELYEKGQLLLEHRYRPNAIDEAIAVFEDLIAVAPRHAGAFAGLAQARLWQFSVTNDVLDLRLAMQAAERSVELDDQLSLAHVSLALVQIQAGLLDAAQAALERALVLEPSSGQAHLGMGRLGLARKQTEEAEAWFTKASHQESSSQAAFKLLGILFYNQGRYEESVTAFTRSHELLPGDPTTLRNLGGALHMQGRVEEAAAALQKSLLIDPRASVYNNLGTLLFFQGRYNEAARAFEKAVEMGPNVYPRWANLGDAYRWIPGKDSPSREAYEVALELIDDQLLADPASTDLLSHGALYHAKLGACASSKAFSSLLDTATIERGVVFFRLGIAAELCDQRTEALQHLERALERGYSREELTAEPELRSLRQDPRYHRLVLGR